jgi:hypothetical protein
MFIYIKHWVPVCTYTYIYILFLLTWQDQQQRVRCISNSVTINDTILLFWNAWWWLKHVGWYFIKHQYWKQKLWLTDIMYIVTYRPVSRKRVGKHVSAEIRFSDTNHRWVLNKRFHGYENESCRLSESSSFMWNQQACPSIRAFNKHFHRIPRPFR